MQYETPYLFHIAKCNMTPYLFRIAKCKLTALQLQTMHLSCPFVDVN